MAKCVNCGKSGLFLKVNARGLCKECAELANSVPGAGQIVIGIRDSEKEKENASIGHRTEEDACQFFINELATRGKEASHFAIEHRARDYTSLVYDGNDFIRIKMTENVNWISISLSEDDKKEYADKALFYSPDMAKAHWKSYFDSFDSLRDYVGFAERACIPAIYGADRPMTDSEITVANYLRQLFINCGADPDKLYYELLSQNARVLYASPFGNIDFKTYAKKPGGYILADYESDKLKIKSDKGRIPFVNVSDLDFLQEKLIPRKIERGAEMAYGEMQHYAKFPITKQS